MSWETLKKVFDAIAAPYREYGQRYRRFDQESKGLDDYNDWELIQGMDPDRVVSLGDIHELLVKLRSRTDFQFSDDDFKTYLAPFFKKVTHDLENCYVESRLAPMESVEEGARIKVGDLLDILEEYERKKGFLPDGLNPNGPKAKETVYIAVDPEIDDSTALGAFQKKVQETMPLRTPTSDVREVEQETDRLLNVRRPLIMAIGYAAMERDQRPAIEAGDIPSLQESQHERMKVANQRRNEPRYYRGIRMD